MRVLKSEITRDIWIALAWSIFVGLPLFTLHMLILDYEYYLHGISLQFPLVVSLKSMFPNHPISIGLWLIVVFITALSIRRAFRQQREILAMKGIVERFQYEAYTDGLTGVPNRSAFNTLIKTRFEFAKRANQPLTIVMVDVDGFKVAQRSIWPHSGRQSLTRCCQTSDQTCSSTGYGGALWRRRICDRLPWTRTGGEPGLLQIA